MTLCNTRGNKNKSKNLYRLRNNSKMEIYLWYFAKVRIFWVQFKTNGCNRRRSKVTTNHERCWQIILISNLKWKTKSINLQKYFNRISSIFLFAMKNDTLWQQFAACMPINVRNEFNCCWCNEKRAALPHQVNIINVHIIKLNYRKKKKKKPINKIAIRRERDSAWNVCQTAINCVCNCVN